MTDWTVALLVPASTVDNAETEIATVETGYVVTVTEAQLNPYAAAGVTDPCKFWGYHRAIAKIGTTSFGDGPTLFRHGVPQAPDAPSSFPSYAAGVPNQNTMLVPPGTGGTTAPKPLTQWGPTVIGGNRSISVIMGKNWNLEVRLYGTIEPAP